MSDNQQQCSSDDVQETAGPRTEARTPTWLQSDVSRRDFVKASAAAGASAMALGSGASSAAAQSKVEESCVGEYEVFEVGGGNWHLMNNLWGMPDSEQCIWVNDDGTYGYDFSAVGDGINYPEVFCGGRPWGSDTGIPELPGRRGDIDELVLEWDVDIDISGGEWDFAEEWWLLDGQPGEDPPLTHEIMIVLDWGGGHGHYMEETNVWTDQFGNQVDYWANYSEGGTSADFHIFRINGGASSGKVDLMEIVDFMSERHGVSDDLTMTGIEVGNEYWAGAQGEVTYNQLDLTVNGSTYQSGPGGTNDNDDNDTQQPPSSPGDVWVEDTTTSSISIGWSSVGDADEYHVSVDGSEETTTSGTSTTVYGLDSGTDYELAVEAANDAGRSGPTSTWGSTDTEDDDSGNCTTVDGQTVCDVNDDGMYRDVTGDGSVGQTDVVNFFEVQHRSAWKQPSMFDFSGNGDVGHGDVVTLFEYVATL